MEEGAHHWVAYQVCQRTVGAVTSIARRHKVRAAFSQRTGKGTDPVSDIGGEVSVEANQVFGPDFDHVLQRSSQCSALATAAGKLRFNAVCHCGASAKRWQVLSVEPLSQCSKRHI